MNVPKLRFKKFTGEWNCKKLNEIVKFSKGNILSKADLNNEGQYPCILYGQLYTKYHEVIKEIFGRTDRNNKNLIKSKYGDILIPSSGETPIDISTASCILLDNVLIGGDINILSPINSDGRFMSYMISNNKKFEIAKVAQGHSIVHLYNGNLKSIKLSIPSKEEQTKIANFLSLLDKKIELQTKKIEALKLYKKGLTNKLFRDTAGDIHTLSNIALFENGRGHENIIDEFGNYILINSKFISTNGSIIKRCKKQLTPLYKGNITMVMSDLPNGKALAKCYYVEKDNLFSLNQRICKIEIKDLSNFNSKYIYYRLNRNPYFLKFDDGVNQTNLKKTDILNIQLLIPNIFVQNRDANLLSLIDNKLHIEIMKIDKLIELKKGLMQNMFV